MRSANGSVWFVVTAFMRSVARPDQSGHYKLSHYLRNYVLAFLILSSWPSVSYSQPIDRDLLAGIEDGAPVRNAAENAYESRAYHYLVVQARKTAPAELARVARQDLTFAHLFEEASKYRGEVVHVEGRLRRLRKFDAPPLAAKEGVAHLYEGWVFTDASMGNPYCVIVSELSAGIVVGEKLDLQVSANAYFFKRYRYQAGDGWRDAPLLMGRSLALAEQPATEDSAPAAFSDLLFPLLLVLASATLALCLGLAWWFRRGDHGVRTRLERIRSQPADDSQALGLG